MIWKINCTATNATDTGTCISMHILHGNTAVITLGAQAHTSCTAHCYGLKADGTYSTLLGSASPSQSKDITVDLKTYVGVVFKMSGSSNYCVGYATLKSLI